MNENPFDKWQNKRQRIRVFNMTNDDIVNGDLFDDPKQAIQEAVEVQQLGQGQIRMVLEVETSPSVWEQPPPMIEGYLVHCLMAEIIKDGGTQEVLAFARAGLRSVMMALPIWGVSRVYERVLEVMQEDIAEQIAEEAEQERKKGKPKMWLPGDE